ncbi:hypothetical protein GPJ56_005747 [Histomonas meleagridis]|uniref:uncharacterized protein n=1 Tax=Histomonas meleagridis TaxID=135588 RepID=UPI00355A4930|nr:hypothetical protein GPJ56_005747 [Histomonas meleagridis]KAH0803316.1 hypothetical protein GO595_003660 [Histomonas meleagridis]
MDSSRVEVYDCTFKTADKFSLYLYRNASGIIRNSLFSEQLGKAIFILQQSQAHVFNTRFEDCQGGGISIADKSLIYTSNCIFLNVKNSSIHAMKESSAQIERCTFDNCGGNGANFECSTGYVYLSRFINFHFPPIACFGNLSNPVIFKTIIKNCHSFAVVARDCSVPSFVNVYIDGVDSNAFSLSDLNKSLIRDCHIMNCKKYPFSIYNGAQPMILNNVIKCDKTFDIFTKGNPQIKYNTFITEEEFSFNIRNNGICSKENFVGNIIQKNNEKYELKLDDNLKPIRSNEIITVQRNEEFKNAVQNELKKINYQKPQVDNRQQNPQLQQIQRINNNGINRINIVQNEIQVYTSSDLSNLSFKLTQQNFNKIQVIESNPNFTRICYIVIGFVDMSKLSIKGAESAQTIEKCDVFDDPGKLKKVFELDKNTVVRIISQAGQTYKIRFGKEGYIKPNPLIQQRIQQQQILRQRMQPNPQQQQQQMLRQSPQQGFIARSQESTDFSSQQILRQSLQTNPQQQQQILRQSPQQGFITRSQESTDFSSQQIQRQPSQHAQGFIINNANNNFRDLFDALGANSITECKQKVHELKEQIINITKQRNNFQEMFNSMSADNDKKEEHIKALQNENKLLRSAINDISNIIKGNTEEENKQKTISIEDIKSQLKELKKSNVETKIRNEELHKEINEMRNVPPNELFDKFGVNSFDELMKQYEILRKFRDDIYGILKIDSMDKALAKIKHVNNSIRELTEVQRNIFSVMEVNSINEMKDKIKITKTVNEKSAKLFKYLNVDSIKEAVKKLKNVNDELKVTSIEELKEQFHNFKKSKEELYEILGVKTFSDALNTIRQLKNNDVQKILTDLRVESLKALVEEFNSLRNFRDEMLYALNIKEYSDVLYQAKRKVESLNKTVKTMTEKQKELKEEIESLKEENKKLNEKLNESKPSQSSDCSISDSEFEY